VQFAERIRRNDQLIIMGPDCGAAKRRLDFILPNMRRANALVHLVFRGWSVVAAVLVLPENRKADVIDPDIRLSHRTNGAHDSRIG
jgi:hypothetical protein